MPQETPVNKSVYETEFEEFLSVNSRANQSRAFAAIFGVLTESQQGRIVEALGGKAPLPPQEAPATEGLRRKIDAESRLSLLIDTIMLGAARCGLFDMAGGGPYTGTQALAAVRDLVDELVKLQEADRARGPVSPITFHENDGTERTLNWGAGDPDVGIPGGYVCVDGVWDERLRAGLEVMVSFRPIPVMTPEEAEAWKKRHPGHARHLEGLIEKWRLLYPDLFRAGP